MVEPEPTMPRPSFTIDMRVRFDYNKSNVKL